jgi:elongation factor Ts
MGRQSTQNIEDIKWVREQTGAGIMEAKRALEQAAGDRERAIRSLQQSGAEVAARKAGRTTANGIVTAYIHHDGQSGALVELDSETDFVARSHKFKELAYEIAMQIVAHSPQYTREEDVPVEVKQELMTKFEQEARDEGKPEAVVSRIAEGKYRKWLQENVLLHQPYIRDQEKTVEQLIHELILQVKENIVVKRWCRFQVGV